MNPTVDIIIREAKYWQQEMQQVRLILLDCGLVELIKWKNPCYTYNNNNIAIIGALKAGCVLSFFKGALLQDAQKLLQKPGEQTQAARIITFTNVHDIVALAPILKAYIYEAIEIENAGIKVARIDNTNLVFVTELQRKLDNDPAFKKAFEALTPGRQRAYNLYFSAAKQAITRVDRIEKYTRQILNGKGINDCTCGLSQKLPYCDGSHKFLNTRPENDK